MPISKNSQTISPKEPRTAKAKTRAAFFIPASLLFASCACLFAYTWIRLGNPVSGTISAAETELSREVFFSREGRFLYPFPGAPDLSPLSWPEPVTETVPSRASLKQDIKARSAIVIDASTGTVLLEKNADERIPPASMTKLVAMYTAFHAAETGEITFDDTVDLPEESWAVNIPPGSSLMFLAQGQRVTVRELLTGMAVVSGNDAAIALACHISGSVPAFIDRMNGEMEKLGLANTRFVEPSGLSELNMTTAREFADFAFRYIREYPEALRAFHSRTQLEYPMPWNVNGYSGPSGTPVIQSATNRLLGVLEGCDGLKTGFIYESGYNLSLTCERDGNRFISVTMGGPGGSSWEGNLLRSQDGSSLMEWAFGNFSTVRGEDIQPVTVTVWKGSRGAVTAIPSIPSSFTAPAGYSISGTQDTPLQGLVTCPAWISAPVYAGSVIGRVDYVMEGDVVHSVPLIADRNIAEAGLLKRLLDTAARFIAPLIPIK